MWLDNWTEEKQKRANEHWEKIYPIAEQRLKEFIAKFDDTQQINLRDENYELKQRIQQMKELQFV